MKTHNAIIYHCLHCGNVVHREPDLDQPSCCGKKMVKAAAETIVGDEDEGAEHPVEAPVETVPPPPRDRPRPR